MPIKISKTTEKKIKKFNEKEYRKLDIEYFGKPVTWARTPIIFKATENGKIAGTMDAHYTGEIVFIKDIVVAKTKRRQGIGSKLIRQVEKEAKRLGAHKIFFYTGRKWYTNKFYKKLGYKIEAILPKHCFKIDYVIYSKFI